MNRAIGDVDLAAGLARRAGRMLLALREESGLTGKALGIEGDRRADALIVAALREARPADGILCEESQDTFARLEKSRVWIVDPVDGTREYGEGRSDWAVHVGLAVDGAAKVGAVALPGLDLVLTSAGGPLPPLAGRPRLVVSRTRPAAQAVALAEAIGGVTVPMGSAGAKAMAVVRGEAEIYLHSGGQYEWDNCAPAAVAAGYGLHCSRIDGSPLVYNRENTYLPDLLICRPEWADRALDFLNASPA